MARHRTEGFTILEVLIVAVMGAILIGSVAELLRYQLGIKQNARPKGVLVDLMTEVSVEVSAKSLSGLPPIGFCYVRIYSKSGELVANDVGAAGAGLANNSTQCTDVMPADSDKFKIIIRSKDAETGGQVDMEFNPSSFLKLPTINRIGFVAIEVEGGFRGSTTLNEFPQKLSFVTFKGQQ
jgi:hypothetical protein